jgi:hypothetical protein
MGASLYIGVYFGSWLSVKNKQASAHIPQWTQLVKKVAVAPSICSINDLMALWAVVLMI